MYTQCPRCDAVFRLQHAHLRAAGGHVRCNQCDHVFNAAKQRLDSLPDETELNEAELEMEQKLSKKRARSHLFALLFALLLTTTLALQYLWFTQAERWLKDPLVRPWIETSCTGFNQLNRYLETQFPEFQPFSAQCTLPIIRHVLAFKTSKHHLAAHEIYSGAATLHLVFQNTASFTQPYPRIDMRIENENNKIIAIRHLMPKEYLPDDVDTLAMPAAESRHIKLDFNNVVADMHSFGYQIDYQ